ncbi:MAG: NAD(P)H-dependent glycerol-3-phosphate dehydrogenase [Aaplasma endosymbiont of Hyalomma asiaticum]
MQVTVLGAGAFGTALSVALCNAVEHVSLWSRNLDVVEELKSLRQNSAYLPGYSVPKKVDVYSDLSLSLNGSTALLLCVPTQELRNLCNEIRDTKVLHGSIPVLVCSKGIENNSLKLAGEVLAEVLPNPGFVLSGPALAREIVQNLPCAMVLAGNDLSMAEYLSRKLSSSTLKIVSSGDYLGVQIGAVLKNVIAIACGIITGKGLGYNAATMVIVQGIAEIKAVCKSKSGHVSMDTITGLSCLGDLVLTCTSHRSRNMSFGLSIGQNNAIPQQSNLVEGVASAHSVERLGKTLGIDLPVCNAISQLLQGHMTIDQVVERILSSSFGN